MNKPVRQSQQSAGLRRSSASTKNTDLGQKMLNKMAALRKGKNVYFTMDNPNKNETNKRQIRVKVDGTAYRKRMITMPVLMA